jgi:hypothetical protein
MAFDASKPIAAGYLNSAEIRSNWAAVQATLYGKNWIADPGHYIWPFESANGAAAQTEAPAHFGISGSGATLQRCGVGLTDTEDYTSGGWAAELTYDSATARFFQNILDGTIPGIFEGLTIAFAAAVKCSSSNAARLYTWDDDTGYTYASSQTGGYHTGGGDWEWIYGTHVIGATTDGLQVGVELSSSKCYVQGWTALLGEIPALYPIPSDVIRGAYGTTDPGPSAAGYFTQNVCPGLPFLLTNVAVSMSGAPSGGTAVFNLRKYDGAAWQDMLDTDMTIGDGHAYISSADVDATYSYRCLTGFHGASAASADDAEFRGYCVTNAGGGTGALMHVRGIQFSRPQDMLVAFNDPTKFGAGA